MCIFTVKTLIKYYTDQNTPVYTCLLDASKAFDRFNHWTLFAKLIESHAPLLIVRNAYTAVVVSDATGMYKKG